jgi:outer membrane biosynthesis protein TonB/chaperonin cofactor prefoldin
MDVVTAQDPKALVAELEQTRERIDAVACELHAVDAELGALAAEREQHRLLHDACRSLERLDELGGAALFWGDAAAVRAGTNHVRNAREQAEGFQQRVGTIEQRRQALLTRLEEQQSRAFLLEDDVFEAQEEEERRRQEWLVEREIGAAANRALVMPWARGGDDDRRYRKSLMGSLLVCLLLGLLVLFVDIPLPDPTQATQVPERVVRMMMEKKRPPAPTPRTDTRPVPEERVAEQKAPERAPKPTRQPPPETTPQPPTEAAKPEKGILAFREKLASLKNTQVSSQLGLQARLNNADDSSGPPERAMLTTNAPGSSGGIALGSLSRGLGGAKGNGGGGMAGVQVTRASSAIGGGGGAGASAGSDRPHASGGRPTRTDEEIQIVFDRYKASLYRLYNRELRKDPALRGQMVLRLTIEPDGGVSMCVLQSSDMNAPELSAQVVDRVRAINFGAKDVDAITIVYPIDFLPAA